MSTTVQSAWRLLRKALLFPLAFTAAAPAGEWRIQPNLGISERYSDNINGAPEGLEEDDFITNLTSGLSLQGDGARVKVNANYSVQKSYSTTDSRNNNLTHFLSGSANTEIIENTFFVDANASIAPTLISNSGRISNQNFIDVGGNRADVTSYTITPRAVHHLGTYATATAQTTFGNTSATQQDFGTGNFAGTGQSGFGGTGNFSGFGNTGIGGSDNLAGSGASDSYTLSLVSGRRFARSNWGLTYTERTFDADQGGGESTTQSTIANVGYRISRKFRMFANVGQETTDFIGDEGLQDGMTWAVGAEFNPTPRTTVSGSYGDRSFGSTKNFNFSHRMRRVSVSGNYTEDLSTTAERLQRQQQELFRNVDVFGNPLNTPLNPLDLTNVRFPISNLSLTNDVFISRNLSTSIGYQYRLNSYNASIFRSEQETVRTAETEEALGVNFSWSRPLGRRFTGTFNVNWQDRSSSALQESTQALFITPSITYRLGPDVSTNLSYSYSENTSDLGTNDFQENAVIGSLSYAF